MGISWLGQQDSNLRITDYEPVALPLSYVPLVGAGGIEPPTYRLRVGSSTY